MLAPASKAALLKNLSGAHLRWRWSTLTYLLFKQKMFRFFARRVIFPISAERTSWNSPLSARLQPDNKFCPLSSSGRYQVRAGGFQRGRLWCGSNQPQRPFGRILWLLSWRDKKVTLPHYQKFCTPKFLHNPSGMWKTFLWKTVTKKFLQQGLLISSSFQHLPCGEKSVAALEQKGLFHINLYYHCYD